MSAPPNYVFTIFAFVSFFLCLIRFPMQWHAWNIGIHLYQAWVGLFCLSLGINSIIWNHNTVNWAPVWCDITSRLIVGFSIALPAVILSINRRLYFLASPTSLVHSEADKRREIMIDLAIGIGLPVLEIIFNFFAQDCRFVIVEDYGCSLERSNTWVDIIVCFIPPILLEFISGVYGCLSIYAFYKRRTQMNQILSSHENLNSNRYIRLMCFSICDLIIGIPITVLYLYMSFSPRPVPYLGLKQEHYHLSEVYPLPAVVWRATTTSELSVELNRWIGVFCGFVFFAIFGFSKESRNNYRAALQIIVQSFKAMTGIKSRTSRKTEEYLIFFIFFFCSSSDIPKRLTFKAATPDLPLDTVNSDIERVLVYVDAVAVAVAVVTSDISICFLSFLLILQP